MDTNDDRYNLKTKHSVEEYKTALKACRPIMQGTKYLAMLQAHYMAPDHELTASQLAEAVGYASWSAANTRYGAFAGAVAEALGHARGKLEGVGVEVTPDVAVLVAFDGSAGATKGSDVSWQLLPAVVQALEEMTGWVPKRARAQD